MLFSHKALMIVLQEQPGVRRLLTPDSIIEVAALLSSVTSCFCHWASETWISYFNHFHFSKMVTIDRIIIYVNIWAKKYHNIIFIT